MAHRHTRRALRVAPALLVSLVGLGGCSFLIDFDELQTERGQTAEGDAGMGGAGNDGGSGGDPSDAGMTDGGSSAGGNGDGGSSDGGVGNGGDNSGGGGANNSGGDGGAAPDAGVVCDCPPSDDPCIETMCNDAGECVERNLALVLEADETISPAPDEGYATTLVAGEDKFYLAVYGEFSSGAQSRLWMLDDVDTSLEAGPTLSSNAVSPAALVPNPAATFELNVVFAEDAASGGGQRVRHLTFDRDLDPVASSNTTSVADYQAISDKVGPAAGLTDDGQLFAAWPTSDGIRFYRPSDLAVDAFYSDLLPADNPLALAAFSAGNTSVVAWAEAGDPVITIANVAPGLATTLAQIEATTVAQCTESNGFDPFQMAAVSTPDPGLWALTTTSNDGDVYQSQLIPVACRDGSDNPIPCTGAPSCDDDILADASDLAVAVFQPDGSSDTYSAIAFAGETDGGNFVSLVQMQRTPSAGDPESVGDAVLLGTGASEEEAPHSHHIAVLDSRLLAATWIEPNPDGEDTVRIQRYQICTPGAE